jgi:hypothetical protein
MPRVLNSFCAMNPFESRVKPMDPFFRKAYLKAHNKTQRCRNYTHVLQYVLQIVLQTTPIMLKI